MCSSATSMNWQRNCKTMPACGTAVYVPLPLTSTHDTDLICVYLYPFIHTAFSLQLHERRAARKQSDSENEHDDCAEEVCIYPSATAVVYAHDMISTV